MQSRQSHAAADPGLPTAGRLARRASADERPIAAARGMGGPPGQHAESRTALVTRARGRRRAVHVGAFVARPALGPSLLDLCRPEARLRALLAWEAPGERKGPDRAEAIAERVHALLDGRRMTDSEAAGAGSATRSGTRRRRAPSLSAGRARGRRPSGPSPLRKSPRPPHSASWRGATCMCSGRPRPTASPAGPESRRGRRPRLSRRSRESCCRFGRRSATSGCSQRTSRRCDPPSRPTRPRACCRAGMPTSCSTERSASCSFRARIGGSGSGRRVSGPARSSSPARSAAPGGGRATPSRIETWARLSRGARDAVEAEAATLPLPGLDRPIEVVWETGTRA